MINLTEKQRAKKIYKVTIVGAITNLLLIIFKFTAGLLGKSSAMTADAVHSLSDFITDIIVIGFVKISGKPSDVNHKYGHGKYETLATLLIGVLLLFVGLGIAWNGIGLIIYAFQGNILPTPGILAFMAAILSILLKETLYWYTVFAGQKLNSQAVIANAWHHRSDAFSSIATAAGITGAIVLGEKWAILDPLAGILVSFFIARVAIKLIKSSLEELLEKSLPKSIENEIEAIVDTFENISHLHNLRTRKIGNYYAIEFHIRMDGQMSVKDSHDIITKIEKRLKDEYGNNTHIIIHTEPLR
jgi:cation diffusion facilitator family transporter